jgi:pyrophosphatase PpaX
VLARAAARGDLAGMTGASILAVLFDLDGTLVDSIELIRNSARHAFARHGPAPSDEEFLATIGRPLTVQLAPYATSDDDLQLLIRRYREYQLAHHDRLLKAYDGIAEVMDVLERAGHLLGVVTSKMTPLARRALSHTGLERHVRVLVGADLTERHKPDPEPVLHALAQLGVAPGAALFVGDSPYDVQAGRAAGARTVAVTWGPFPRSALIGAGADFLVDRPLDLPALIQEIAGLAV